MQMMGKHSPYNLYHCNIYKDYRLSHDVVTSDVDLYVVIFQSDKQIVFRSTAFSPPQRLPPVFQKKM